MQLKLGPLISLPTTHRSLLPLIPNHNNNQPFNNVNLSVSEVQVGGGANEEDDDRVPIYSLYDIDGEGEGEEEGEETIDDQHSILNGNDNGYGNLDGGGQAPSENLKFVTNEYGFMELLSEDEDDDDDDLDGDSSDPDSDPAEEDPSSQHLTNGHGVDCNDDEIDLSPPTNAEPQPAAVSCVTCGCFALPTEFFDEKHCTYDCAVITRINERKKREIEMKEEEETNNKKKRVKLEEQDGVEAERMEDEEKLVNPFRVNDLLEAIDPEHQSLFCPAKVIEIVGFRMLLKFIGYPDKYNFWVNADSQDIFPVEWTTTYNESKKCKLHFHPPPNFTNWQTYITLNSSTSQPAPPENFPHITSILNHSSSENTNSSLQVGMKLEAIDIRSKNLLICVATVSCVMGDRFLVHFDSWDSLYDYWTSFGSSYVYPVGYCGASGIEITPPHSYESDTFSWPDYLQKTNSIPVPPEVFKAQPTTQHSYTPSQQVEAIDVKRSPRLLRPATITQITSHTVRLHFNSLPESYDYDLPLNSPDIHLVGWGRLAGVPVVEVDDCEEGEAAAVQPDFPTCPNHQICRSVGSLKSPNLPIHSKLKECAYALEVGGEEEAVEGLMRHTDRVVVFEDKFYDIGGGGNVKMEEGEEEEDDNEDEESEEDSILEEEEDDEVGEEEPILEEEGEDEAEAGEEEPILEEEDEEEAEEEVEPLKPELEEEIKEEESDSEQSIISDSDKEQQSSSPQQSPTAKQQQTSPILQQQQEKKPLVTTNTNEMQQITTTQPTLPTASTPATTTPTPLTTIPKRSEILQYSHENISSLVHSLCSNLPTCQLVADRFRNNLIDGESFLMLTQNDMTEALGIKLGPAVKIFNLIKLIGMNK